MRFLIVAVLFCSCSASWHLKKAIQKGAKIDSTYSIKYDTICSESIRDSIINIIQEVDTAAILALCEEIKGSTAPTIRKIQIVACKAFRFDSTYQVVITAQDTSFHYPIRVRVYVGPDLHDFSIDIPKISIPVKTSETDVHISAPARIPWWIWIIIAAMGLVILRLVFNRS